MGSEGGGGGATGETTRPTTVSTARLDDMFFDDSKGDVLFMKIDMEDNEFEVLKSAEKLLTARRIHNVVAEVRRDHGTKMVKYLYDRGYNCALIREYSKAPVTCRGQSLAQISTAIQGIPEDGFSDIFCCVTS